MARYYFNGEDGNRVYIKEINFAEGKLEFTDKEDEAYRGRDGYYAKPLRDQISTMFSSEYPQVKNLEVYAPYY